MHKFNIVNTTYLTFYNNFREGIEVTHICHKVRLFLSFIKAYHESYISGFLIKRNGTVLTTNAIKYSRVSISVF